MRIICCLLGLFYLLSITDIGHAAIYKWVDENGTVTFRDTPPPQGTEADTYKPKPLATVEYDSGATVGEEVQGLITDGANNASNFVKQLVSPKKSFPKVELYVTSWCGYCVKAKSFFNSNGVPFKIFDIEENSRAAKKHRTLAPNGSVPVAIIGGEVIRGYAPELYSQALGL